MSHHHWFYWIFFFLFLNPKNVLFLKILIFLSYSDGLPDSSLATENTDYPSTASSFTLPTRSSKIHAHDAALQHLFPQVLRKRGRKWVSSLMQEHNANSSQSTVHHRINKEQNPKRWARVTLDFSILLCLSLYYHLQSLVLLIKGRLPLEWVSLSESLSAKLVILFPHS